MEEHELFDGVARFIEILINVYKIEMYSS